MKEKIKQYLLARLHAIPRHQFDVSNSIINKGVREYISFDCKDFKRDILEYVNSVKVSDYSYKYAKSCFCPCLYASIYAVMIEGLLGVLAERDKSDLKKWADYLNSFQNPDDGLYYDSALAGDAYEHIGVWNEGWGKHHLMGHMIIALARLGATPKYPLKYLEEYYDVDHLTAWMEQFDLYKNIWTSSNYFMNLYTVLEYARDYMDDRRADKSIKTMVEWLLKKQNPTTGLWHDAPMSELAMGDRFEIVRGAYHFYPLFIYEGIDVPHKEKIVDSILPLQNSWGGWTLEYGNAGACEDIDALEPLIRFANSSYDKAKNIDAAIKRSMIWQLSCRNADKGFSFYSNASQEYGGHPLTSSKREESSMFATWFRTLCLAYEMQYLGIPNEFNIGRFPGYEISL